MSDQLKDPELELRGRLTALEAAEDDHRKAIAALSLAVMLIAVSGLLILHHLRSGS